MDRPSSSRNRSSTTTPRSADIAIGIATPPQLRSLLAQVGVPRIYVDSGRAPYRRRIPCRGDSSEADNELWGWYKANSLDSSQALLYKDCLVLEALRYGSSSRGARRLGSRPYASRGCAHHPR